VLKDVNKEEEETESNRAQPNDLRQYSSRQERDSEAEFR
jgi:hypothetical protein